MLVPTNMNNMMQLMNMIKNGNPQEIVMNMLEERAQGNPLFANMVDLVQKGDTKSIEGIVRNMAKERGIDFDKEFNSFKHMFGL